MEFDIEQLRRDWIEGVSGESFYKRVHERQAELEVSSLVISEEDPIEFSIQFFAALSAGMSMILVNPKWGEQERLELQALLDAGQPSPGAILIPTGGTTGGVKLAIHDWASLCASARALQGFLGGGPIHSCCLLPLHHVSGLMQLVRSFVSGGRIRFDDTNIEGFCLSLVPTQLQRALQSSAQIEKLHEARVIFVGGAAMSERVAQQARELKLPVVPVYGMTETAAMIAAIPNEDFLASSDAGGVALGDAEINIDPDGSIRLHSSSLFKGYHGGAAIDPSEGFRTGDSGWFDGQGRLHLQGRMDCLINTGGEKVDPSEVQEALLRLDGVAQARVVGEPDEEWGERVVAYVRIEEGFSDLSEREIQTSLKNQLSPYKIPKQIRFY